MYAYIAPKSTTVKEFKKPIRIDPRGRTFEEVKNTFKFTIKKEENRVVKEVIGSKGNKYIIEESENGLICGCPGFKFRGKCKHI
jgi:bifunctional ADP-heptose synthase (sugar kinase/adenylyltransferase)